MLHYTVVTNPALTTPKMTLDNMMRLEKDGCSIEYVRQQSLAAACLSAGHM